MFSPVCFDDAATGIAVRHRAAHSAAALRLEVHHTYGRAGRLSIVRLRWTTVDQAKRAAGFVRWQCPAGLPMFISYRLMRYLEWHPLQVAGRHFGPFHWLSPLAGPYDVDEMLIWERMHPDAGPHETLAA